MSKRKKKLYLLDLWQIEEQEAWLSDMHSKGWRLIKLSNLFATFEQTEPRQVKYRLEIYKKNDRYEKERIEMYDQFGWDYVSTRQFVHVFREKEGQTAKEIHTDPIAQSESIHIIKKSIQSRLILISIITALMIFISIKQVQSNTLSNYMDDNFLFPLIILLTNGFIVLHMFSGFLHAKKLIEKLSTGNLLNHHANYKRKLFRNKAIALSIVLIFVTCSSYMIVKDLGKNYSSIPDGGLPVVQLSDIIDTEAYARNLDDSANYYSEEGSLLVPNQLHLRDRVYATGGEREDYNPRISSSYYEARNDWIAGYVVDTIKEYYERYEIRNYEQLANNEFDELWINNSDEQELITRKGNIIHHVRFSGYSISMEDFIEKALAKIQ